MKKLSLRQRALDILSRQEISRQDLMNKLLPFADSQDQVIDLLNECSQKNWQSDARFTNVFINSKSRNKGRLWLTQALQQKGVDKELIQDQLPSPDDEVKRAVNVLHKKYKGAPESIQEKQKYIRFASSRGFEMSTIQTAMSIAWDEI